MPGLLPHVDPDGLLEYSVVYTDRALNHMSARFQGVMRDISHVLRAAYQPHSVAVVPGSGTFGMEAVARQFAQDRRCLVLRHGWFSFRWSQILQMGRISDQVQVLKARPQDPADSQSAWTPAPLEDIVATILRDRPEVVFAPHVETSSGMILPDAWLQAIGQATHEAGGLFVLDCIASGAVWVDMAALDVDVLVSAPQKGWSGSPGCAFVMLSARARERLEATTSTSFAADLKKWVQVMETYESGAHTYHATMPTDALTLSRAAMLQTQEAGFEQLRDRQWSLGSRVRALMAELGWRSVAAPAFAAPGVVVSHTRHPGLSSAKGMIALGLQTASGVPLQCDEPADFQTFRVGLFGLDKLADIDRTVGTLAQAMRALPPA